MNVAVLACATALLLLVGNAEAGLFGPSSRDECFADAAKKAGTEQGLRVLMGQCVKQFPYPEPPPPAPPPDPTLAECEANAIATVRNQEVEVYPARASRKAVSKGIMRVFSFPIDRCVALYPNLYKNVRWEEPNSCPQRRAEFQACAERVRKLDVCKRADLAIYPIKCRCLVPEGCYSAD